MGRLIFCGEVGLDRVLADRGFTSRGCPMFRYCWFWSIMDEYNLYTE